MSKKYYIDTQPLGAGHSVVTSQGFFARQVNMSPEIGEALIKLHKDFFDVQAFFRTAYANAARRDYDFQLPDNIKEILCLDQPSDEQPSAKDTAPASKSQSRRVLKPKAASTATKKKASSSTSKPRAASSASAAKSPSE